MPTQTATTGNLENAQNVILMKARYTEEHSMPTANLVEKFTLAKGSKQLTVPKVGQMTAQGLTDGVDLITSSDIGLTTTDLTTAEVGLKMVATYKLINQFNEDVFAMVGRQMGDAMARKKERDIQALFPYLNGSAALGADNINLYLTNAAAAVTYATAQKYPTPVSCVHHPNAIGWLSKNAAGVGTTYFPGVQQGLPEELLRNFWGIKVNGVNFYQSGEIDKVSGYDSGYGAIFSKSSMCIIEGWAPLVEREKDISLRAWEIVITSDYGVFELDDSYGAPMLFEIGTLSTINSA